MVILKKEKALPIEFELDLLLDFELVDSKVLYDEKTENIYVICLVNQDGSESFKNSPEMGAKSPGCIYYKIDCKSLNVVASKHHFLSKSLLNVCFDFDKGFIEENSWSLNTIKMIDLDSDNHLTVYLSNSNSTHTYSKYDDGSHSAGVYDLRFNGTLILNLSNEGEFNWLNCVNVRQFTSLGGDFQELSHWTSQKLIYIYTNRLFPDKLFIEEYDKKGVKIKKTEIPVQSGIVYLDQNEFIRNERIILYAIEKQGLLKVKAYFMELKY